MLKWQSSQHNFLTKFCKNFKVSTRFWMTTSTQNDVIVSKKVSNQEGWKKLGNNLKLVAFVPKVRKKNYTDLTLHKT